LEGFWPSTNWRANYECTFIPTVINVDLEDYIIPPYHGPRKLMKLLENLVEIRPIFGGHQMGFIPQLVEFGVKFKFLLKIHAVT